MPHLIIYLLKVNAALILFFAAYRFGLRRLTFYYLNRFFLVFGIVFSTVYPLVNLAGLFAKHEVLSRQLVVFVPDWHAVAPVIIQKAEAFDYWQLPIAVFWMGVVLMAARLLVQFISLYRIYRKSTPSEYNGQDYRLVNDDVNPFSFWQSIYLNPNKHSDDELRSIIRHEQIHVKQWHTLDVLLAELSTVFYWFNPGVWLMKQAIKENLEFITDSEILQSGIDEKVYQYSLVRVSSLKQGAPIVNNFNFMTIKKRIMMMNKKRSSKAQVTRYVVLLPAVMLLALIITVSKAELNTKSLSAFVKKVLPKAIISQFNAAIAAPAKSAKADTIITGTTRVKNGKTKAVDTVIARTYTNFGTTSPVTTSYSMGTATDSTVVDKVHNTITLYGNATLSNSTGKLSANVIHVDSPQNLNVTKAAIVINGKLSTSEALKVLTVTKIDSITVLNSGDAVKQYGAKGKFGAIQIKLKPGTYSMGVSPGNSGLTTSTFGTTLAQDNTFSTGMVQGVVIKSDGDVKAADDGEVIKVTEISGTYLVLIKKGQYFSAYSNLKSAMVAKGDKVAKGQIIGVAGIDPATDESDMHYELYDGVNRILPNDKISKNTIDYLINPANTGPEEFGRISKMFREGGFLVEFHQDLNTPDLLEISAQSKTGKCSATFRLNELTAHHYLIHIGGNENTGDVSVNSEYAGVK